MDSGIEKMNTCYTCLHLLSRGVEGWRVFFLISHINLDGNFCQFRAVIWQELCCGLETPNITTSFLSQTGKQSWQTTIAFFKGVKYSEGTLDPTVPHIPVPHSDENRCSGKSING
jgi:hypothetical protein